MELIFFLYLLVQYHHVTNRPYVILDILVPTMSLPVKAHEMGLFM